MVKVMMRRRMRERKRRSMIKRTSLMMKRLKRTTMTKAATATS